MAKIIKPTNKLFFKLNNCIFSLNVNNEWLRSFETFFLQKEFYNDGNNDRFSLFFPLLVCTNEAYQFMKNSFNTFETFL